MIELLLLVVIFLVSAGLGKKVFSLFKFEFSSFLEELLFSTGLGLGLLSIFTFLLGILKLLYPLYAYLLLLVCGLICFREIFEIMEEIWVSRQKILWKELSLFNRFTVLIIGFCFLILLISTYNPPIDGDVLLYHLSIPKIYLKNHAIIYLPFNFFSNFPFLVETLFIFALLLKSDLLAQQIHFLYGILAFLGTFNFARKHYSFDIALLASAIFLTIPTVFMYTASIAFIDLALAFYFTLAIYSYYLWGETQNNQWIILSGLMAGFNAAAKPQGTIATLLLGLFFLGSFLKLKIEKTGAIKLASFYCSFALILPAFWLVKSYFHTGNPVFPFLYQVFGGKNWDSVHSEMLTRLGLEQLSYVIRKLPVLPWAITMEPEHFNGKIGPLFLAFLPGLFLNYRNNKTRNFAFLSVVFFFVLLFSPNVSVRYLAPVLPLVSILAAIGVVNISESLSRGIKLIPILVVSLSFVLHSVVLVSSFFRPPGSYPPSKSLKVIFGLETRDEYLSRALPYYQAYLFINKKLPPGSKILTLGGKEMGVGGYYIEKDYLWGSPLYQAYINYWKCNNSEEVYQRYKEVGVTHILFEKDEVSLNPDWQAPFDPRGQQVMGYIKEVLDRHCREVYRSGKFYVYELK